MKRFAVVLALVAGLTAGCGGDEKKDSSPVPPPGEKFDKSKDMKGKKPGPGFQ